MDDQQHIDDADANVEEVPLFDKPNDDQANDKEFRIGLVMAGAISAGAYTAGVMDFMIEALKAWEKEKNRIKGIRENTDNQGYSEPDIPMHNVQFDVLAGASAGGMCAGIFASALRDYEDGTNTQHVKKNTKSPFYRSWVLEVGYKAMMQDDDLKADPVPRSLLNVSGKHGLEGIKERALNITPKGGWPNWLRNPLPIMLSVNNLRGVPYSLGFSGASAGDEHGMTNHKDFVLFSLHTKDENGKLAKFKDSISLEFQTDGKDANWHRFGEALLATGAFPAAFPPRKLKRDASLYGRRKYAVSGGTQRHINWKPIPNAWENNPPQDYQHFTVDGGTLNNEPMDLARKALADKDGRNSHDPKEATRMILMVDPFPNPVEQDIDWESHGTLIGSLARMIGAFKAQARFKIEDLLIFGNQATASRFSIAPSGIRGIGKPPYKKEPEKSPLACASLGAFGGILDETWRHHDYLLGRLNCQQFLKNWFTVDKGHRLFAKTTPQLISLGSNTARIIPLVGGMDKPDAAVAGIEAQNFVIKWPNEWDDGQYETFFKSLKKRLGLVLKAQLKQLKREEIAKTEATKKAKKAKWWQLGQHVKNAADFVRRKAKNGVSHLKWLGVDVYLALPRYLANGKLRTTIAKNLKEHDLYSGKHTE